MHIYTVDGIDYPSVTTVLSMIEYDEGLMKWANAMGFQRKNIKDVQTKSCDFGTLVHSHLQSKVDESAPNPLETEDPYNKYDLTVALSNFERLAKKMEYETIYTEHTLIDKENEFAGTLDWYLKMDEKKTLIDFKTSKKPYPHYLLQLGGYAKLLEANGEGYPEQAGIFITNRQGASLHMIDGEKLREYTNIFLSLNAFYKIYHKAPFEFDYNIGIF